MFYDSDSAPIQIITPQFMACPKLMSSYLFCEFTKKILDYLGLSHRINHKPNELSGGEQQRVAVARALINKPAIIFADEPSGNLDTHSAENLHQLFFKLRDEFGQTFVIVTHNEDLANMADRKLIMVDGMISN